MNFIFLSYINRSGSTFLINQLSKRALFCVCPEADILYDSLLKYPYLTMPFTKKNLAAILKDTKFQQWNLSETKTKGILLANIPHGEKFLQILELFREEYFPESSYIVFKHNYIFELEPFYRKNTFSASFYWVILQRNALDVYASQKNTMSPQTGKVISENVLIFCMLYSSWRKQLDKANLSAFFKVNYEELILQFEPTWISLFSYLHLTPGDMNLFQTPGRVLPFMTPEYQKMHPLMDQPPDRNRINNWRTILSDFEKHMITRKLAVYIDSEIMPDLSKRKFIFLYFSCLTGFFWFRCKFFIRKLRSVFSA